MMNKIKKLIFFLLFCSCAFAQDGLSRIYVVNRDGAIRVDAIDPAIDQVIARISLPDGADPALFKSSPDGTRAVLVYEVYDGGSGDDNAFALVINVLDSSAVKTVPIGADISIRDIGFSTNGEHAVILSRNENETLAITLKDTSQTVVTTSVGEGPERIAVSPTTNIAYITCEDSNNIYAMDLNNIGSGASLFLAGFNRPEAIAISSDGNFALVSNRGGTEVITRITLSTKAAISSASGFDDVANFAITSDNTRFFVSQDEDFFNVVSTSTLAKLGTATGFDGDQEEVLLTPDNNYALVRDGTEDLFIVNANTLAVTKIEMDDDVSGFVVNPESTKAYISVDDTTNLQIINLSTLQKSGTITVGLDPRLITIAVIPKSTDLTSQELLLQTRTHAPNRFNRGIRKMP